jgi:hypothetical protein
MKKLIAVALLGLAGAQGIAVANENNTYTEPYWAPRKFVIAETTQQFRGPVEMRGKYDLVDRFNP